MHPRNSTANSEPNGKPLTRLAELENSLVSIRQARDTALSRAAQLTLQLSRYEERLSELIDKVRTLEAEREVSTQKSEAARLDRDRLQETVLDLNSQKLTLLEQERVLQSNLRASEALVEEVTAERDELAAKLANVGKEHDRYKAQQTRNIADLAEKYANSQKALDGALSNLRMLQLRIEKQRTELGGYQQQVVDLTTGVPSREAPDSTVSRQPRMVLPRSGETPPSESAEVEKSDPSAFRTAVDLRTPSAGVLAAIHLLIGAPDNHELLETLETNLSSLEQRSRQADCPALNRHVWSMVELTRWLRKSPSKTPEYIPALRAGADLLPDLASIPPEQQRLVDPATALVYAVDDDMDNCECIAMALEKLQIGTVYETCSERALVKLLDKPLDLLILDVDMPGVDGIAFYEQFRTYPAASNVPVLFISGLLTTESRLKRVAPGNFTYVSKPYNLASLALTVTTMLLRTRIKSAFQ